MLRSVRPLLAAAVVIVACSPAPEEPPPFPALASVPNEALQAGRVQITLRARVDELSLREGTRTTVYRYAAGDAATRGPSPVLVDAQVGDELVVDFHNELPEATTIHWHGVRLPAAMDGNPFRIDGSGTHASHDPTGGVPPRGTFRYAFTLRDEGLFWFHPHLAADTQVDRGLYGVLRVRARGASSPPPNERILVLDDVGLDAAGKRSWEACDGHACQEDHDLVQLGRGGPTILVNGQDWSARTLGLDAGALLRFVNVANGRFFNLSLPGFAFLVIATDGGRYPRPYRTRELVVVPGERVDAYLVPDDEGVREATLVTLPFDRGHGTAGEPPRPLFRVHRVGTVDARGLEAQRAAALPGLAARVPTPLAITLGERPAGGGAGAMFTFNGATWPEHDLLRVQRGGTYAVDVINDTAAPHPFHLHGFFFEVLERDGVPEPPERRVAKDTLLVPRRSRVRLGVTFDEPGLWMAHCHILEHAEHGMMGLVQVE